ncbi:MAG: hypothetical protein KJZ69_16735 [Phycisphaerales bacterium]|nr:hypothetical protein [Phycisphaerales bacterium]
MTGASGSKATQVEANTRERAIERPTRWDALPERRLSTPYTRTRATRCYNHGQLDPPNFVFDMAALRATQICVTYIGNNQGASRYTPIKYDYESAAAAYNIANFDPHPDECGGCPQQ